MGESGWKYDEYISYRKNLLNGAGNLKKLLDHLGNSGFLEFFFDGQQYQRVCKFRLSKKEK